MRQTTACVGVLSALSCPDPATEKTFWENLGFQNTMKRSPENQLDIYEGTLDS